MEVEKKALDWDAEDDSSVNREDAGLLSGTTQSLLGKWKIGNKGYFGQILHMWESMWRWKQLTTRTRTQNPVTVWGLMHNGFQTSA